MLVISDFMPGDADAVIGLIRGSRQGKFHMPEFQVPLTPDDRPDLQAVAFCGR